MRFRSIVGLLLPLVLSLSGCLSGSRINELSTEGVAAINNVPRTIIGAARSAPNANQGILDTYEGALENRISAQSGRLQEMHDQLVKEEKAWKDALMGIAQVVASAAGITLPGGATLDNALAAAFGQVKKDAKTAADDAVKPVENKLATVMTRVDTVEKLLEGSKQKSDLTSDFEKRQAEREKEVRTQLAEMEKQQGLKLGELQNKFDSNVKEITTAYSKLQGDELKAKVLSDLRDQGISPDLIKKVETMSPEELLAMLGAGGGGLIGLFGLLRTFGPSRSQNQTDVLEQMIKSLAKEIDLIATGKGPVAAAPAPAPKNGTG